MKVFIEESTLTAIGDAIRGKTGSTGLIPPLDMAGEIEGIQAGGSEDCNGMHIPEEALTITGNCSYRFAYDGMNWFIGQCGDKITTVDITDCTSMFYNSSKLEEIPFDLNFKHTTYKGCPSMFNGCSKLKRIGKIKGLYPSEWANFFNYCNNLREFPEFEDLNLTRIQSYNYATSNAMFNSCYSLRSVPESFLKEIYGIWTSVYSAFLYGTFKDCWVLDEAVGMNPQTGAITTNMLNETFSGCYRVKDIIFAMQEDGSPYVCNWKNQTLNLSGNTGTAVPNLETRVTTLYNSGITNDKRVIDDATYQALKDDPDWFTSDFNYSRYNKTSAINTINSLPDVSQGTGNTVKFKGIAGSKTDGGAIQDLPEETIALAASRGWTVTFA